MRPKPGFRDYRASSQMVNIEILPIGHPFWRFYRLIGWEADRVGQEHPTLRGILALYWACTPCAASVTAAWDVLVDL